MNKTEQAALESFQENWLTTSQVADLLGLTDSGVQHLELSSCLLAGRNRYFPKSEVAALLQTRKPRGRPAKKGTD